MNNINNNAILFQPTGEVRKAEPGEWVQCDNEFIKWVGDEPSVYSHSIYTRHEIPAEVGKKMMEVKA